MGGMIGLATIQPGQSTRACVFSGLAGVGCGAPIALCIAGVHLASPHALIATATALMITCRAVAATTFTAIYSAALTDRLEPKIIDYVSTAAVKAGLPLESILPFVGALAGQDMAALPMIPGVTPDIIKAGVDALQQAYADSLRVIFIIAVPFGAAACLICLLLRDQSDEMNYRVDAPVEDLHARHHRDDPVKV